MKPLFVFLWVLTSLLSIQSFAQIAEENWQLQLEKDGIAVYTRPQKDDPIDEFKGVTIIQGNIDSAFLILRDTPRMVKEDPSIRHSEIIQVIDSFQFYDHQVLIAPFFMKDRDVVMHVRIGKTSTGYFLVSKSEPDYWPEQKGLVRQREIEVLISLRRLTPTTFELMYKGSMGSESGDMAVNFTNKAIITSTLGRLENMRKLLSAPSLTPAQQVVRD